MIGYVTLGSQDLERSAKFYDPIAAEMGVGRMMEFPTFIAWGDANGAPGARFGPHPGRPALGLCPDPRTRVPTVQHRTVHPGLRLLMCRPPEPTGAQKSADLPRKPAFVVSRAFVRLHRHAAASPGWP